MIHTLGKTNTLVLYVILVFTIKFLYLKKFKLIPIIWMELSREFFTAISVLCDTDMSKMDSNVL